ncbi:MAG: endonuclease/exonuclease/phosphatase family protein [Bacteroidales bacterium]|nr:endonuclease/exonuclease/phosphatase family protein [Bacteroidales bacterium]
MKKFLLSLLFLFPVLLQAQEADFRIMSFNIERGDLGVPKGWGWDVRKPAALEMLQTRHPDLLGVQECNSEQRDDILARMGDYDYIGVSVAGETGEHATSANFIFYNREVFELLEHGEFWYAFQPDSVGMYTWIAQKPRNATWGKFRHKESGRELLYINNHLQNGVDAVINRAMSVTLLLEKMRQLNPEGIPMLYSGDLNSKCIEGYYAPLNQEMREAALTCPVTDMGTTLGGYKRKDGDNRIDHIFFSGALEGLKYGVDRDNYAGLEYVSDHFPVYADMRFTEVAPAKGSYWYDLKPSEGDFSVKAGTWNLFSTIERDERGAPTWNSVKQDIAAFIPGLEADIMAFQEITDPMARDLPKLLKNSCGKDYKLWIQFSDPNPDNMKREAVALLYNAARFSISKQRVSWITAADFEAPSKPWGDEYRALLSAVFTDKATGKKFFVLTGRLCRGENPIKYEGNVIKKIEKELNKDQLPCILLADMNTAPKGNVWLSLLNYWTDTYTLMHPFPDTCFSTRVPKDGVFYESNIPKDWTTKYSVIGISRYVENSVIVTEHTVHREIASMAPVPSDHCPITATLVFK